MVNPLRLFEVIAHPLGNQINIEWEAPETFPTAWEFILFKKAGSNVDQSDIDDFIISGTNPESLEVQTLPSDTTKDAFRALTDFDVVNETQYYYKMVVNDTDNVAEYSTPLAANVTPSYSVTPDIVDSKEAIINVIEKILLNYGSSPLKKAVDYDVRKAWGMPQGKEITLYVTRAGEQVGQRFIGDLSDVNETEGVSFGEIDVDNILVTWSCRNAEHRDTLTNIFRETKEAIRDYLQHPDACGFQNANIVLQGDSVDRTVEDRIQQAGSMMIQITMQVDQKFTEEVAIWFESTGELKN